MDNKTLDARIDRAFQIELETAQDAGALGYMATILARTTMPHRQVEGNEFRRRNGNFLLTMLAPSDVGLPYGSIPRLLMAWLTTEAVRTRSQEIVLGSRLSDFLEKLQLQSSGGPNGSIGRLRNQMNRLFSTTITSRSITDKYGNEARDRIQNALIVEDADLWWDPRSPEQPMHWKSRVALGRRFFESATESPIPVDLRVLQNLRRSPMALDIYCWLTHRMSYLREATHIPWGLLQEQFGADFKLTRQFKVAFARQLRQVLLHYPKARVYPSSDGLELHRSPTHVRPLRIVSPGAVPNDQRSVGQK